MAHQCNIDCGLSDSGCVVKEEGVFIHATTGYMQVIPPAIGRYNYRVEYRCGDETRTVWVDADRYEFDAENSFCRFFVSEDVVFIATMVWSITVVKENPKPVPVTPTPAPWGDPPLFPPPFKPWDDWTKKVYGPGGRRLPDVWC